MPKGVIGKSVSERTAGLSDKKSDYRLELWTQLMNLESGC